MSSVVSGAMVIPVAAPSTAPGMPAAPARRDSLRVDAAERTNLSNIDRMRVIRQNMVAKRITQIKFDEGLISGAAVEASEVDVTSPSTSLDPTSPEFLAAIAALSKQKAAASSASGGSDTASQPRSSLEVLSLKANGIYRRSRLDKFTDDDGLLHFPPTSADYAHILPSNHVTSKHSFSPKSLLPKSSSLAVPSAPVVASTILADDSKFVSDVPFEVKVTEIAKDTSNDLTSELSFFDEPPSLDLRFDREAEIGNVDIKPPPLLKNDQDSKPSELDFERLQESTGKIVGRISPSPPIETISNLSSTPSPPISTLNDGQKLDHYHYESFRTELPPLEHPSSASPTPSSIFPSTYGVAAVDTLSVYSFNQSHGGYAASAMPSGGQTSAADDTVGNTFSLRTMNKGTRQG
ncbi:hypothetical protein BC829DRAFT_11830 [Chytridium lagenaria]|nr:hypothetical protein BC829DRAFT_11830 [Chytridium lagenaria]